MNFWFLFGGIFFFVGFAISAAFIGFSFVMPGFGFGFFTLFPLSFMLFGLGVLIYAFRLRRKKKDVSRRGRRYQAKIYGYVEDKSFTLNGDYTVNLKVHFFDYQHVEREAVIVTNFPKNSDMYGIGMTIDIFEYEGRYDYDKKSLRYSHIEGEEELMDDHPILPEQQSFVAVICPGCGASFKALRGYASRCPYCDRYLNA